MLSDTASREMQSVRVAGKTSNSNLAKNDLSSVKEVSSTTTLAQSKLRRHISQHSWIGTASLIAFSVLFTLSWASLLILWRVDIARKGLVLTVSSNHLAWTYGPTAILVFVVSLWRQVDYHCKATQPWRVMNTTFKAAEETVFLDYLWPLQITSFVKAVQKRHFPVALSIFGFALLKLITLVSTALLVLTETQVGRPAIVKLENEFNLAPLWQTLPRDNYIENLGYGYYNLSTRPLFDYMAALTNGTNLSGVVDGLTFQSFDKTFFQNAASLAADVDVFVPLVTCEAAQVKPLSTEGLLLDLTMISPTCSSLGLQGSFSGARTTGCVPDCPPSRLIYGFDRVNCSLADGGYITDSTLLSNSMPYDFRLAVGIVNVTTTRYFDRTINTTQFRDRLESASAVLCKIDYSMARAEVVQVLDSDSNSTISRQTLRFNEDGRRHLRGLGTTQLTELVWSLERGTTYRAPVFGTEYGRSPTFALMNRMLGQGENTGQLLNPDAMNRTLSSTLGGLTAHFARNNFFSATDKSTNATAASLEQRLHVQETVLFSMVAGFLVMSAIPLAIAVMIRKTFSIQRPTSLVAHAIVLPQSRSINELLQGTGSFSMKALQAHLMGIKFRAKYSNDTTTLQDLGIRAQSKDDHREESEQAKGWIPYLSRRHAVVLMLALFVAGIVCLEILHQKSRTQHGLLAVDQITSKKAYAARYGCTLIVFLLATLFNSLDFAIAVLAPFSDLAKAKLTARRLVQEDNFSHPPPIALYRYFRDGQYGASLSSVGSMAAGFLTIVVSGLWVITQSNGEQNTVEGYRNTLWSVNWRASASNDFGAGNAFNQVQHGSKVQSPNIWGDIVIPEVSLSTKTPSTSNYTFVVPALRPQLDCQIIPSSRKTYFVDTSEIAPYHMFTASSDLSKECISASGIQQSYVNFTSVFTLAENITWFGYMMDLNIGSSTTPNIMNILGQQNAAVDGTPGCPSIGIQFGWTSFNQSSGVEFSALICSQRIEEVQTTVHFIGDPALKKINPRVPPQPDEGGVRNLTNGSSYPGSELLWYQAAGQLNSHLTPFGGALVSTSPKFVPFNQMILGPNGTAFDNLVGSRNEASLIQAVQKLYKGYMTTVIDLGFRNTTSDTSDANRSLSVTGTTNSSVARLGIDFTSKLVLQILLGVMTLCGGAAYLFVDMRRILPRNPSSIVSTMSLLVGSRLCEPGYLPDGAEHMSTRELERHLGKQQVFSLGWWNEDRGRTAVVESSVTEGTGSHRRPDFPSRRFGIDAGRAQKLGFVKQVRKRKGETTK